MQSKDPANGPTDISRPSFDALKAGQSIEDYHLLPSVRRDLLLKLRRREEALIALRRLRL